MMIDDLHLCKNEHDDDLTTLNTGMFRQECNIVNAFLADGSNVLSRILDKMMIVSMYLNLCLYMGCQISIRDLIIEHGVLISNATLYMTYIQIS